MPDKAFAELGGTAPHIISGMVDNGTTCTDGVLYCNGEIIPFVGGALGTTIKVTTYNTTLIYGDGSSHNAQTRKEASFGTGAVQFNYADLKLFQQDFGSRARTIWMPVLFAGGTCAYLHNKLTNTVYVRGTWVHSQSTTSGNPMQIAVVALPLAPPSTVFFRTAIETHTVPEIYTEVGTLYTGDVGRISDAGYISISSRKLAVGTPNPTHNFYFSFQI